jgi:organic hydroperoxide reductase OsmC/OhrA
MAVESTFTLELERIRDYEFRVRFDWPDAPNLTIDEPPPLGGAAGPNASRLLAAAVANCLSASLLFCLEKSRVPPRSVRSTVTATLLRGDAHRLRIGALEVVIDLEGIGETGAQLARCSGLFEEFCVVTASVRQGIPVGVTVRADGEVVHREPAPTVE